MRYPDFRKVPLKAGDQEAGGKPQGGQTRAEKGRSGRGEGAEKDARPSREGGGEAARARLEDGGAT